MKVWAMRDGQFGAWIAFAAGLAALAIGFVTHATWNHVTWGPTYFLGRLALMSVVLGWLATKLLKCRWATGVGLVWLLAFVGFVGAWPSLSMLLVLLAAMGLGSALIPVIWPARQILSILVGLAIICGFSGWLLPFAVHRQLAYLAVFCAAIYVRRRALIELLRPFPAQWSAAIADSPAMAVVAVLALGIVSTSAWVPSITFDDLAYHLAVPSQLSELGFYRMDAATNVWAVSAWAGDILHAIVWIISGQEARGPVVTFWLLATSMLIWLLCRSLELSSSLRWIAVALYASLPLTAGTLSGMQTEGASAALAVASALIIQALANEPRRARMLLVLALLFGYLLALKIINILLIGPLGLWLLWQWRGRLPWRAVLPAALIALMIGGSSYIYAYALTGNPVLPLFNNVFRSPYFDLAPFNDVRWHAGIAWNTVWKIVFQTSMYMEGGEPSDGIGGFLLLGLLGSLLVAIYRRDSRAIAIVSILMFVLPFVQVQYLRYAHPSIALMVPAMLSGLPRRPFETSAHKGVLLALLALVVGSLMFLSSRDWQQSGDVVQIMVKRGKEAVMEQFAPTRMLAIFIKRHYGEGARTLIIDANNPFSAEFSGKALVNGWYDMKTLRLISAAKGDESGKGWETVFDQTGANLLILAPGDLKPSLWTAIQARNGVLAKTVNNLQLWQLGSRLNGDEVPAKFGDVAVRFDASRSSATSLGPTLVSAIVTMQCDAKQAVPIAVSWGADTGDGSPWARYEWIGCLPSGIAKASLDISVSKTLKAVMFQATPARPADLQLKVLSSTLDIRRDSAVERDLSQKVSPHYEEAQSISTGAR